MSENYDPTVLDACTSACNEMHRFDSTCQLGPGKRKEYYHDGKGGIMEVPMLEPQVADDIPLTLHLPVDISPQARYIIEEILPDAIQLFVRKNKDYTRNGRNISENFGVQGQFMKMHDKIAKLWKPLWDGERTMEGEQPEEILQDMLAHVLLTLYFLQTEENVEI